MLARNITQKVLDALSDSPVLFLAGARQTGKSTLVQWIAANKYPAQYFTLDDLNTLSAIKQDPQGFLEGIKGSVILDEIQRAPEIFLPIKLKVDQDRQPGRFLLTGSANVLLLPKLSESLVGRMEIIQLWPFSQGEWLGKKENFIDLVFNKQIPSLKRKLSSEELIHQILQGGYPEVLHRESLERKAAWFHAYITTLLQRDVRDLAQIEGLTQMPRLLSLLAARAASLLNYEELSRSLGMNQNTLKRYFALLQNTYLVQLLPAWTQNTSKRLVKSPKIIVCDTGLMAALLGIDAARFAYDKSIQGSFFENFVVTELMKQATWSHTQPQFFHFRVQQRDEVDLVLENKAGEIVGIEIKSSSTLTAKDFSGIKILQEITKERFLFGLVLYQGKEIIPFGPNLYALPLETLWDSE